MGVPSINFYCNSIYQFENVASIAAKADFAWHTEKDARSLYLAVGANPIWLQMAADPAVYHPIPASPRRARAGIHWPAVRRPCQVASCFGASECSD